MKPFKRNLSYLSPFTSDVYNLQVCLEALGLGDFIPSGLYGSKTRQAVINFQAENGLPTTGTFGPLTREKMNKLLPDIGRLTLYNTALKFIGHDASPYDLAPDEYACMESVYDILATAYKEVGFPFTASTNYAYTAFMKSPLWKKIEEPIKGCVYLSPTGYGNGKVPNGHIGIYEGPAVLSNNSSNGIFDRHLTVDSWKKRYVDLGGYPICYFNRI